MQVSGCCPLVAEEEDARILCCKLRVLENDKTVHRQQETGFYSEINRKWTLCAITGTLASACSPKKGKKNISIFLPNFLKSKVYLMHTGARHDIEA